MLSPVTAKGDQKAVRKDLSGAQRRLISRISDGQIERTIGTRLGMRLFFAGMRRLYRPDKAKGFRGEIQFSLTTPHGVEVWTLNCHEGGATITRGPAAAPQLQLRAKLTDFLRVATGDLDAGQALVTGRLGVRGDFGVAARLGELFGGKAFF